MIKIMGTVPAVPHEKWWRVGKLYTSGLSMQEVAKQMGVSIDAITYVLRKTNVPRRSFLEANRLAFESKKPSFTIKKAYSRKGKDLELIGAMLYWAEGYKTNKATGVDFANSDPAMAACFMHFLRSRYVLDRKQIILPNLLLF